jgi:predicted nucleic acid-binding protein
MTVLDTTVLIEHLRGVPAARDYLRSLPAVPTCSEVTRTEVLQGLRSAERPAAEALFAVLRWTDVDERVARRAGELGRRYRRSHPGLSPGDLLIAATALELGQPLATLNVRHFPMLPRLRPPY